MRPKSSRHDHDVPTILVVDDDHALRELVQRHLRGDGFQVSTAENGDDALDYLMNGAGPVDLLLTDIEMVGLDGLGLAERVRKTRPDLPVLFMTGSLAAARQASPVITKPFRQAQLLEMVRRTLDGG